MLYHLANYATRCDIAAEQGFIPKTVRWFINFNDKGKYLGVSPTGDPKKGRNFPKVPNLKFSGDTPMRQFLVDTAQYTVLYDQSEANQKLLNKHQFYLNLLHEAAGAEPVLGLIADAIADPAIRQAICDDLATQTPKVKPSDNVTFAIIGDQPRIIVDCDTWRDWWRSYFPTLFKKSDKPTKQMRCFLTGEMTEPAMTHPKIKGLGGVGGNVETTLVGFNKDSFCSFGLEQSANACISTQSAEQYAAGLNHLLNHPTQSRMMAGVKIVYWYTGDKEIPSNEDPLLNLFDGDNNDDELPPDERDIAQAHGRAADLLDAIKTGKRPDLQNATYCAMTLSGNSGRAVVRDWMEGSFEQLLDNVVAWHNDFEIINRYGDGITNPPKFGAVLAALVRELKEIPGPTASAMFHAAVKNLEIPGQAMAQTLARVKIDIMNETLLNHARMGLLKAYRIRKGDKQMTVKLNENYPDPAYHCGRLLAVLADIQEHALIKVNAGVIQRYYAAASVTPSFVIGRLIRTSHYHLEKIKNDKLRFGLEKRLKEIMAVIPPGEIPETLTPDRQSLFALGYYHQKSYRPSQNDIAQSEAVSTESENN